jgi:hypothetical protein
MQDDLPTVRRASTGADARSHVDSVAMATSSMQEQREHFLDRIVLNGIR